jgi:CBS domain-containing protein
VHDIAEFLKDHDPFSGLDAPALERLAERVEVEFFAVGTTIFKQGHQPPDRVRVIRRGAVELVDHGRVLDLLGEGELLGHPSMVSATPTGLEARAHEDSLCYSLSAEDVLPLLTRPAGLQYLARSLLARPKPGPVVAADVSGFDLAQQPVRALIRGQPVICEPEVTVREVARRMVDAGATSVLVRLDHDDFGIVTDQDLRTRVVAVGRSVDAPVREVMTAPAFTVGPDLNGADLLLAMLDHGIRHVPVLSARAEVLGVVSDVDLLAAETRTPFVLRRAIGDARDLDDLRRAAGRMNPTLIGLHQVGVPPAQISAVISVVGDALVRRAIELAVEANGPPPQEFAWLALGSLGRREAVPSSDVDSGMVWTDGDGADPAPYMHAIGEQVIATLAATGWQSDTHGVTASGTVSARSVSDWQRSIRQWLDEPVGDKVPMVISILLDSRTAYGPDDAFDALAALRGARGRLLASLFRRLALASKPPTGFLRDIIVEHSGEHRGSFDIKRGGILPIVDIARFAALSAGAQVTSTVERLRAGAEAGTLPATDADTLAEAHDLFSALRLEHQVQQLVDGVAPDDRLDPTRLNPLTKRHLRDAFRAVASVQKAMTAEAVWGT